MRSNRNDASGYRGIVASMSALVYNSILPLAGYLLTKLLGGVRGLFLVCRLCGGGGFFLLVVAFGG